MNDCRHQCRKLNKMPGHNVLCGAARCDGQGPLNAASEFSPFVPNFSLVPSCEGKIRYVPREKNGTEGKIRSQVPDRWAGAGRDGGPGRDGGQGRDGNSLECRFGAEYRGKNSVFFTGFFPRGTGYFPRFPGFFPREKSSEFEGKILCNHGRPTYRARRPKCA